MSSGEAIKVTSKCWTEWVIIITLHKGDGTVRFVIPTLSLPPTRFNFCPTHWLGHIYLWPSLHPWLLLSHVFLKFLVHGQMNTHGARNPFPHNWLCDMRPVVLLICCLFPGSPHSPPLGLINQSLTLMADTQPSIRQEGRVEEEGMKAGQLCVWFSSLSDNRKLIPEVDHRIPFHPDWVLPLIPSNYRSDLLSCCYANTKTIRGSRGRGRNHKSLVLLLIIALGLLH